MKTLIILLVLVLFYSNIQAKDLPLREGYRQLKLTEFPKSRNGIMPFIYSEASSSNDSYSSGLSRNQELMMDAIVDSMASGRVPMANSIWKKFIKSLHNGAIPFDLNNVLFNIVSKAYLNKKFSLTYRARLYKVLNDKVVILEREKEEFKEVLKSCKASSECSYDTKDEIERTNDLWKRRTNIFEKEMKKAKNSLEDLYDDEDGLSRLILKVSTLFFESAEAIISDN